MSIIIRNGLTLCGFPVQKQVQDLLIEDGVISQLGNVSPRSDANVIDATGKVVLPGLIDPHTHFIEGPTEAGYYMLTKAGVTTALDTIICECGFTLDCMSKTPMGLNIGFMGLILPGMTVSCNEPTEAELSSVMLEFIEKGAWGVKIAGAHYPLTPTGTARAIEVAAKNNIPLMFHAGTTCNRDDFKGFSEALQCSAHNPLILAHINCYCRGEEAAQALDMLQRYPEIVSESNLSDISCMGCKIVDGRPASLCVCDTLQRYGHPASYLGLQDAIAANHISVLIPEDKIMRLSSPEEGLKHCLKMQGQVSIACCANRMKENMELASGRNADGDFVIDAFSSDGGVLPRNITLSTGCQLINSGMWSWEDFVLKASIAGSRMLGLENRKGILLPGYDADVVIVDSQSGNAEVVISNGKIIFENGVFHEHANSMYALKSGKFGSFDAVLTQPRWLQETGYVRKKGKI